MRPPQSPLSIDYSDRTPKGRNSRWKTLLSTLLAIGLGVAYVVNRPSDEPAVPAPATPVPAAQTAPAQAAPGADQLVEVGDAPMTSGLVFDTIDIVIKRNDTLDGIFRRLKLSITDLATLRSLPDARKALDFLRPGDALTVMHHDGALQGLKRQINDTQTLKVTRDTSGFAAQIIENPLESEVVRKEGQINSSLFLAANEAGISDQTAMTLAGIFGWDVDFVLDIRTGDRFTVVYEQLSQDGKFLRDGNILAAEFVNNGRTFRAVRYTRPDGSAEYFSPDGQSMRKAFLRAPLEFTRISSRFNPNRRHPILNTIRAHKGVDYAAPTGTPVRAAGDGRVQIRGRHGGYGNAVVLEHGGGVTTLYGHLSRFAKGLGQGQRVRQGQLIGYVGQTGLASGPHLHYEYRLNGVHRNPQTVKLPDAQPISADLLADFKARTAPLLAQLDTGPPTRLMAQR